MCNNKVSDALTRSPDHSPIRPAVRYTYGDYKRWSDDERWELIDGEAWNLPPTSTPAQRLLVSQLVARLVDHLGGRKGVGGCLVFPAPFDVVIPDSPRQDPEEARTVIQPDVCVLRDRRKLRSFGCLGGPDLAVEIARDGLEGRCAARHAVYERAGSREYWLVSPSARSARIFRLDRDGRYGPPEVVGSGGVVSSSVLPGFTLPADELFAAPA